MAVKKKKNVISKDELMEFLSAVVKGEEMYLVSGDTELPNLSMRFKAAELLGKCYGMFSEKSSGLEGKLPVIILGEESIET